MAGHTNHYSAKPARPACADEPPSMPCAGCWRRTHRRPQLPSDRSRPRWAERPSMHRIDLGVLQPLDRPQDEARLCPVTALQEHQREFLLVLGHAALQLIAQDAVALLLAQEFEIAATSYRRLLPGERQRIQIGMIDGVGGALPVGRHAIMRRQD